MAALTVQNMTPSASLTPTFAAAAELGDYFVNNGKIFLYFKNANAGASRVITIHSQVLCSHGVEHDITVTVPLSSEEMAGPFSTDRFNDVSGRVQLTYADHEDLTIAAISIP